MTHDNSTLNQAGKALQKGIVDHHQTTTKKYASHELAHVVGVGRTITAAYEQLRNAAEYTEEHLLLQKAIARYFRRIFLIHDEEQVKDCGSELVVELTLAGYLENDSVPLKNVEEISRLAREYFRGYVALEKKHSLPADTISRWIIDVLAANVERIFNDHQKDALLAEFVYTHALKSYDPKKMFGGTDVPNYAVLLYVAIFQAILHADTAFIRASLLRRYNITPTHLDHYTSLNQQIDELLASTELRKLYNVVNRDGATYRILRQLLNQPNVARMMDDKHAFLNVYMQQIETEYARTNRRINQAIVKSVAFLFITKVLIGVAIEVPYDQIVHGEILWVPLVINLLFPPLFMILLRLTLVLPGSANTAALIDRITTLMYGDTTTALRKKTSVSGSQTAFQVAYTIFGLGIVGLVTYVLVQLQFSWLHILIFFIFISTASFLGFRLSRIVRELEVVEADQSALSTIRDFIYMPFVVMGQWLSKTYSQVNIVGFILDMVIELPMKTILRLIRQWTRFINERKDEL